MTKFSQFDPEVHFRWGEVMSDQTTLASHHIDILRGMRDTKEQCKGVSGFRQAVTELHNDPERQAAFLAAALRLAGYHDKRTGHMPWHVNMRSSAVIRRLLGGFTPYEELEEMSRRLRYYDYVNERERVFAPEAVMAQVGTSEAEALQCETVVDRFIAQSSSLEPERDRFVNALKGVVHEPGTHDPERLNTLRQMVYELVPIVHEVAEQ